MTHKTFSGMARAVERLIQQMDGFDGMSLAMDSDREYRAMSKKVDDLLSELNALWSNPADVTEAARLKHRLLEAWHKGFSS
jgi:hypothetical protein